MEKMGQQGLVQKYEEASKIFENLPRMFSEEETPTLLLTYDLCISQLTELSSQEKDPLFLGCLDNILTQVKWQQEKIRSAYTSQSIPEKPSSEYSRSGTNKGQREGVDRRKEIIKLTQQDALGNGMNDLVGLDDVKNLLKKSVLLPMQFPMLFTGGRKPWNQILLYGPPGTGKSKLAHALAVESKAQLHCVSSADLLSSWLGESEKMIKDLFEFTRTSKEKTILFIDEIDGICRKRNAREGDHTRSIKNQLLIELDQSTTNEKQCFILCATNCPWDIDPAFLRRFQCRIYVPLPDRATRIEIMKKCCGDVKTDLSQDDWEAVAQRTEGFSGADLVHLTNFALQEPLGQLDNNQYWIVKKGKWIPCPPNQPHCVKIPISLVPPESVGVRDVILKDFLKAIEVMPKTINQFELEQYKKYSRLY